MNIVDSSCWIEYFDETDIGQKVKPVIENRQALVVPAITLFEVFKRITTRSDRNTALGAVAAMRLGKAIPLDNDLSIYAADISKQYKLAMADSIIYATALHYGATLWTADKHFDGLPMAKYFDKTK